MGCLSRLEGGARWLCSGTLKRTFILHVLLKLIVNYVQTGNWQFVQRVESGTAATTGAGGPEAGSLPGIRRCHADPALVLLHAGRSLAGLHLVRFREALGRGFSEMVPIRPQRMQQHPEELTLMRAN